jgi:hypothetical protein
VVSLLERLQGEIENEGKNEAAAYDKYACFCKEQADNKQYAIEKFVKKENLLSSRVEDKSAQKTSLDNEISGLNVDINDAEDEQVAADEIRANESAAYATRDAQLTKTITALKNGIQSLDASKGAVAPGLLSQYSALIKNSVLLAEGLQLTKQEPHAYEFNSNEITATLESLLMTFKKTKIDADEAEMKDKHTHEMTSGARRNSISAMQKAASEKSTMSAQLQEEVSSHQTALQETEYAHQADQNFLDDLMAKCE